MGALGRPSFLSSRSSANRGRNISSSMLEVTSRKNLLCQADGSSYTRLSRPHIRSDGELNRSNCLCVLLFLNIAQCFDFKCKGTKKSPEYKMSKSDIVLN